MSNNDHGSVACACENCGNAADGELRGDAAQFRKNRLGRHEGTLVLCELCHECQTRRSEHTNRVVGSDASRRLVVAGPGTGKTYAFREAIRTLPGGTSTLVFTLTNNLVNDLQASLVGIPGREVTANTFHGYCKHLLHTRFESAGLTAEFVYFPDLPLLIEADANLLDLPYDRPGFYRAFANMETSAEMDFYLARGSYYDAAGHDDAVLRVHEHLAEDPAAVPSFDLVIADEFQDFNRLEASFIELLAAQSPIFLAGDDDQALYGFRHASTEFIRQLHADDDRYQNLGLPYCSRCTPAIVEATNAVVDAAEAEGLLDGRIPREYAPYWPDKYEADQTYPRIDVVCCSTRRTTVNLVESRILELAANEGIRGDDVEIAFMVISPERRPDLLRAISKHLLGALDQARFEVSSKTDTETGIDLLEGYRLLRENEESNLGWRIVLAVDPVHDLADIIRAAIETGEPLKCLLPDDYVERHLQSAPEEAEEEPVVEEDAEEAVDQPTKIKVLLTNFLGSKGLAAAHVIIVGMNNGTFPESPSAIRDDEVCRFVVGLTRAKRSCTVVTHKEYVQGRGMVCRPSSFLGWLPEERATVVRYRLAGGQLVEID